MEIKSGDERMGIDYEMIDTKERLSDICQQLHDVGWIALDTEFIPERRYETLLCLIQVASPLGNYLIDCRAIEDLSPFYSVLTNAAVIKITHSGYFDYEIFYNRDGVVPKNTIDTQIAASVLNGNSRISLKTLLSSELSVSIKKEEQLSDWWERPLTKSQIQYALNDVVHLKPLIVKLIEKLRNVKRVPMAREECTRMETSDRYTKNLEDSVMKCNWVRKLHGEDMAFLMKILDWRDRTAKKRDAPVNTILRVPDIKQILEFLCITMDPMNGEEVEIDDRLRKYLPQMHALFTEISEDDIRSAKEIQIQIPPSPTEDPQFHCKLDILKLYLQTIAQEHKLPLSILFDVQEVKKHLWKSTLERCSLGTGWRATIISSGFLAWLNSSTSFSMNFSDENGGLTIQRST